MPNPKILLIDDEPSILDMVSAYLRPEGYEIYTANDGLAGLQAARAHKPDLVVLDIVLSVCVIVLAAAAELVIPNAFNRHLSAMGSVLIGAAGVPPAELERHLYAGFRAGASEVLRTAALAAFLVAVITSLLVSPQVAAPIQRMMLASQRIGEGDYEERVQIPESLNLEDQDELGQLALSFNRMASRLEGTETMRRQLIGDRHIPRAAHSFNGDQRLDGRIDRWRPSG